MINELHILAYTILASVIWGIFIIIETSARRSLRRWTFIGIKLFTYKGFVDKSIISKLHIIKTVETDDDLKNYGYKIKRINTTEYLVLIPFHLGWFKNSGKVSEMLFFIQSGLVHFVFGRVMIDTSSGVINFKVYLSMGAILFGIFAVLVGITHGYVQGSILYLTFIETAFVSFGCIIYSFLARLRVKEFMRLLIFTVDYDTAKYKTDR